MNEDTPTLSLLGDLHAEQLAWKELLQENSFPLRYRPLFKESEIEALLKETLND